MSEFIVADLKVKDDTGGNARLVLSGCVQTSPDVVNLKEPDRNERKDLKVDAYSCCRGDRSARAQRLGLGRRHQRRPIAHFQQHAERRHLPDRVQRGRDRRYRLLDDRGHADGEHSGRTGGAALH